MKHLKYTLALLLCSSILAQTLAPQAQAISISEAFATPAPSSSSSRSSTINEATGKGKGVSYTIDGQTYRYTVDRVETLPETAVEEMRAGEWDLTLFTCTYDGRARVTVRCIRTEE